MQLLVILVLIQTKACTLSTKVQQYAYYSVFNGKSQGFLLKPTFPEFIHYNSYIIYKYNMSEKFKHSGFYPFSII